MVGLSHKRSSLSVVVGWLKVTQVVRKFCGKDQKVVVVESICYENDIGDGRSGWQGSDIV